MTARTIAFAVGSLPIAQMNERSTLILSKWKRCR